MRSLDIGGDRFEMRETRFEMRDAGLGGGESFGDAAGCGAAGDVVAVERGTKRDEVEEVFGELGREGAEVE
jgi:hypothetical protein